MTASPTGLVALVAAMAVESLAQLFLKVGASGGTAGLRPLLQPLAAKFIASGRKWPWVALGVAAYAVEIILYTLALQRLDVSVAFPVGSLCFVGVALLSRLLLGEIVSRSRWLGIGFILAGVTLLTL